MQCTSCAKCWPEGLLHCTCGIRSRPSKEQTRKTNEQTCNISVLSLSSLSPSPPSLFCSLSSVVFAFSSPSLFASSFPLFFVFSSPSFLLSFSSFFACFSPSFLFSLFPLFCLFFSPFCLLSLLPLFLRSLLALFYSLSLSSRSLLISVLALFCSLHAPFFVVFANSLST